MMNKVFVRNLFLAMAITTCGTAVKGSEAPTFTVATNVMVKMRDGVALATDIYLSGGTIANPPQKLPIVLARTPYNKFGLRRIGA